MTQYEKTAEACRRSGVMIDTGRKYYSPSALEKLVDIISRAGLGVIQLHFSEEMGFGIESRLFPWLPGRDGRLCTQGQVGSLATDGRYLSYAELSALAEYASDRGVEVIPSFDSPGHLNYTVKRFHDTVRETGSYSFGFGGIEYLTRFDGEGYSFFIDGKEDAEAPPESREYGIGSFFSAGGKISRVKGTNNQGFSRGIDISNRTAAAYVSAVFSEAASFFASLGCRSIDIGGDELLGFAPAAVETSVLPRWGQLDGWKRKAEELTGSADAVAYDLFVDYMNHLRRLAAGLGYRSVRVWNDEFMRESDTGWKYGDPGHVQFDRGYTVQFWSAKPAFASPAAIAGRGIDLIGADSVYCYYVLTEKARAVPPAAYEKSNPGCISGEWDRYSFGLPGTEGRTLDTPELRERLRGNMICVWSDRPDLEDEDTVIANAGKMAEAMAEAIRRAE